MSGLDALIGHPQEARDVIRRHVSRAVRPVADHPLPLDNTTAGTSPVVKAGPAANAVFAAKLICAVVDADWPLWQRFLALLRSLREATQERDATSRGRSLDPVRAKAEPAPPLKPPPQAVLGGVLETPPPLATEPYNFVHYAVASADEAMVDAVVQNEIYLDPLGAIDMAAPTPEGPSALHIAAAVGLHSAVQVLLAAGAPPRVTRDRSVSALHDAAWFALYHAGAAVGDVAGAVGRAETAHQRNLQRAMPRRASDSVTASYASTRRSTIASCGTSVLHRGASLARVAMGRRVRDAEAIRTVVLTAVALVDAGCDPGPQRFLTADVHAFIAACLSEQLAALGAGAAPTIFDRRDRHQRSGPQTRRLQDAAAPLHHTHIGQLLQDRAARAHAERAEHRHRLQGPLTALWLGDCVTLTRPLPLGEVQAVLRGGRWGFEPCVEWTARYDEVRLPASPHPGASQTVSPPPRSSKAAGRTVPPRTSILKKGGAIRPGVVDFSPLPAVRRRAPGALPEQSDDSTDSGPPTPSAASGTSTAPTSAAVTPTSKRALELPRYMMPQHRSAATRRAHSTPPSLSGSSVSGAKAFAALRKQAVAGRVVFVARLKAVGAPQSCAVPEADDVDGRAQRHRLRLLVGVQVPAGQGSLPLPPALHSWVAAVEAGGPQAPPAPAWLPDFPAQVIADRSESLRSGRKPEPASLAFVFAAVDDVAVVESRTEAAVVGHRLRQHPAPSPKPEPAEASVQMSFRAGGDGLDLSALASFGRKPYDAERLQAEMRCTVRQAARAKAAHEKARWAALTPLD